MQLLSNIGRLVVQIIGQSLVVIVVNLSSVMVQPVMMLPETVYNAIGSNTVFSQ